MAEGIWAENLHLLAGLRELDRECQAFGAESHRYRLAPPASERRLAAAGKRLGVLLPADLRSFYLEAGGGGAGPAYGVNAPADLVPHEPDARFDGTARGLVGIIHLGCGHEVCMISLGPDSGRIVMLWADDDAVEESPHTLASFYRSWLDREIANFRFVAELMDGSDTLDVICKRAREELDCWNAEDMIASLAGRRKPGRLFGRFGASIYHHASQLPWYQAVLEDYRASRASPSRWNRLLGWWR